jgi:hypothetical protein
LKIDYSGFALQGAGTRVDISLATFAVAVAMTNAAISINKFYFNQFEIGLSAGKMLGVEYKNVGIEYKGNLLKARLVALLNKAGIEEGTIDDVHFVLRPTTLTAGIILGFNQLF